MSGVIVPPWVEPLFRRLPKWLLRIIGRLLRIWIWFLRFRLKKPDLFFSLLALFQSAVNAVGVWAIFSEQGSGAWWDILISLMPFLFFQLAVIFLSVRFVVRQKIPFMLLLVTSLCVLIVAFAPIYYDNGLWDVVHHQLVHGDKWITVYFSAVTFTTVGYGDFVPHNTFIRVVAGGEAILGYLIFGMIIATFISMFRRHPSNKEPDAGDT